MILGVPTNRIEAPGEIQSTKRYPIFGILSIAFPLVGIPVAYWIGVAASVTSDGSGQTDGIGGSCAFIMFSVPTLLLGFTSAIVAFIRGELLLTSLLGLIANGAPIAWGVYFVCGHTDSYEGSTGKS